MGCILYDLGASWEKSLELLGRKKAETLEIRQGVSTRGKELRGKEDVLVFTRRKRGKQL